MAHSAQCRLHMAASEPDRNLRFVVGHLMHYEALRLRIVEIEHDVSKSERASAVQFRGTGHVSDSRLQKKPSTGQLGGRKSPPPNQIVNDDPEDDDDEDSDPWSGGEDEDAGDDLGLERFPSGSAAPPRPPPDLMPDVDNDDDDFDEPESPDEPDQATLEAAIAGDGNTDLANLYNGIRKCPCHKHQEAPTFEKFWELPAAEGQKEGVTRALAQVWV